MYDDFQMIMTNKALVPEKSSRTSYRDSRVGTCLDDSSPHPHHTTTSLSRHHNLIHHHPSTTSSYCGWIAGEDLIHVMMQQEKKERSTSGLLLLFHSVCNRSGYRSIDVGSCTACCDFGSHSCVPIHNRKLRLARASRCRNEPGGIPSEIYIRFMFILEFGRWKI